MQPPKGGTGESSRTEKGYRLLTLKEPQETPITVNEKVYTKQEIGELIFIRMPEGTDTDTLYSMARALEENALDKKVFLLHGDVKIYTVEVTKL